MALDFKRDYIAPMKIKNAEQLRNLLVELEKKNPDPAFLKDLMKNAGLKFSEEPDICRLRVLDALEHLFNENTRGLDHG